MHDSDNRGPGRGAADPFHTNRGNLNILRGMGENILGVLKSYKFLNFNYKTFK